MKKKSKQQLLLSLLSLALGNLTSSIFSFCLSLYVFKKTGSSMIFASILLLQPLVNLLFSPLIGYWVDKYHHKKIAIIAQIASLLVMSIFILSFFNVGELSLQLLIIGVTTITLAICDNFQATSYKASTKQMVLSEDLPKLVSLEQFVAAGANILGPIVGGFIFNFLSIELIASLEFFGEALCLLFITCLDFYFTGQRNVATDTNSIVQSFKGGLNYIRDDRNLLLLLTFAIFVNFVLSAIEVGLPVIVIKQLNLGSQLYGIINSFLASGILLISLLLGLVNTKNNSYLKSTGKIGIALAFSFIVIGISNFVQDKIIIAIILCICMLTIGGSIAAANIPFSLYLRTNVPETKQGRVGATTSATVSSLSPLGYAIFGACFEHYSVNIIFSICALVLVIDSIILILKGS